MTRFRMKQGVGAHHLPSRQVVRPGDVIDVPDYQIAGALDKFDRLDSAPPSPEEQLPTTGLRAVHKGHGKYDVVNMTTGATINDEPLSKSDATAMAARPEELAPPPVQTEGAGDTSDTEADTESGDETVPVEVGGDATGDAKETTVADS